MSNKKTLVYLGSILVFAVLLAFFFNWSYPYLYSEALCDFFSPFKEEISDYYIVIFSDIVVSCAALLFAKFVLKKLHGNRMSGIGAAICADLVLTHLAVCLFTAATFWMKIPSPYSAVLRFFFSALFFICLLIYHKNDLLKAAAQETQTIKKVQLLLYGVLVAIPLVIAAFQVYILIFSIDDYVYSPASPVAMYFLPIQVFLQPLVEHIFNPDFLNIPQWQTLCTNIFPYCLLAVLVDCAAENLALRKNSDNVNQIK